MNSMYAENKYQALGIFDSGIGGVSCLGQAVKMLPHEHFIYYGDSGVEPYALLSPAQVKTRCFKVCDFLIAKGVKAIVIACNTASAVALSALRKQYPVPILGMVPAIKVAAEYGAKGKIVIMATGMTLKSQTLAQLIAQYAKGLDIVKLRCRNLITLVEAGVIDGVEIENAIRHCFREIDVASIASIVFGCTHLGFLEAPIKKVLGEHIRIADGNEGTIRHLKTILEKESLLNDMLQEEPRVEIFNSGGKIFIQKSHKILLKHVKLLNNKPAK